MDEGAPESSSRRRQVTRGSGVHSFSVEHNGVRHYACPRGLHLRPRGVRPLRGPLRPQVVLRHEGSGLRGQRHRVLPGQGRPRAPRRRPHGYRVPRQGGRHRHLRQQGRHDPDFRRPGPRCPCDRHCRAGGQRRHHGQVPRDRRLQLRAGAMRAARRSHRRLPRCPARGRALRLYNVSSISRVRAARAREPDGRAVCDRLGIRWSPRRSSPSPSSATSPRRASPPCATSPSSRSTTLPSTTLARRSRPRRSSPRATSWTCRGPASARASRVRSLRCAGRRAPRTLSSLSIPHHWPGGGNAVRMWPWGGRARVV
mmetsp:Transcript_32918/g.104791  ORF Transcript_32918/g.104791 Transcript_32918/m.104791 type:complete len:313 (+) Transcript_32918:38-976(+)